jgi:hypothetical protein
VAQGLVQLTCVLETVVREFVSDPFAVGSLGPGVGADGEGESGDDGCELHFEV